MALQDWSNKCNENVKLSNFFKFKRELEISPYLMIIRSKYVRSPIARLRCSNHSLGVEISRYTNNEQDKYCKYCYEKHIRVIEDEFHFVLVCGKFKHIRDRFLPVIFCNSPNMDKYFNIMSSRNFLLVRSLAEYIQAATVIMRKEKNDL